MTEKPVLEPCFAAAFHGIELCFLLLAEFISDDRKYVFRRPRIEMVANDIQKQCMLLTEVSHNLHHIWYCDGSWSCENELLHVCHVVWLNNSLLRPYHAGACCSMLPLLKLSNY